MTTETKKLIDDARMKLVCSRSLLAEGVGLMLVTAQHGEDAIKRAHRAITEELTRLDELLTETNQPLPEPAGTPANTEPHHVEPRAETEAPDQP
jgi:hypothetical protein